MKLTATILLILLPSVLAQKQGCLVEPVEAGSPSIFTDQVQPEASQFWKISYHETYKIVTNTNTDNSYLLYQCGSEPPEGAADEHSAVLEIPISNVAVTQTTTLPFLEQLDILDEVAVFMTSPDFVSDPCFKDRIESGDVLVTATGEERESLWNSSQLPENIGLLDTLTDMVAFVSPFTPDTVFDSPVNVSASSETTNNAIFEWVKFYSVFFNLEQKANEVYEAASDRLECVTKGATATLADSPKPTVLWAYYSSYCEGWSAGECPNYYCEFASVCAADILDSTGAAHSLEACGGYKFMTIEEVVEFGKDADFWIFPSPDWGTTYEQFGDELDEMKAVMNQQVFDYQGAGSNAWFEQRLAGYYDVAFDFCSVVGTTQAFPAQGWFRNVFTDEVGNAGECTEEGKHSILPYNFECELVDSAPEVEVSGENPASDEESAASSQPDDKPTDESPSDPAVIDTNEASSASGVCLFALYASLLLSLVGFASW